MKKQSLIKALDEVITHYKSEARVLYEAHKRAEYNKDGESSKTYKKNADTAHTLSYAFTLL